MDFINILCMILYFKSISRSYKKALVIQKIKISDSSSTNQKYKDLKMKNITTGRILA